MADQFWENDRPANVEEALTLLRYGAVMSPLRSEQLVDQARTEKRMKACADFFEMALRARDAPEVEKDAERLLREQIEFCQTQDALAANTLSAGERQQWLTAADQLQFVLIRLNVATREEKP